MFGMATLAAHVHGHVLKDAENGHIHLAKHLDALAGIQQGNILGRGDDHRTGDRGFLRQGKLYITGTGRHVDHQIIQLAPEGLLQHLYQCTARHGAAPDHGCALTGEKSHGHGFQPVCHHRQQPFAIFLFRLGTLGNTQHSLLAGPVDVGIQQPHAAPQRPQRQRQIHRCGRFADATLAGGNGDDVLDCVHDCRIRGIPVQGLSETREGRQYRELGGPRQ